MITLVFSLFLWFAAALLIHQHFQTNRNKNIQQYYGRKYDAKLYEWYEVYELSWSKFHKPQTSPEILPYHTTQKLCIL